MDFAIRFLIVISIFGVTATTLTLLGIKSLPPPLSLPFVMVVISTSIIAGLGATQYAYRRLLKDR